MLAGAPSKGPHLKVEPFLPPPVRMHRAFECCAKKNASIKLPSLYLPTTLPVFDVLRLLLAAQGIHPALNRLFYLVAWK